MKKLVSILLASCLALAAFSGCTSGTTSSSSSAASSQPASSAAASSAPESSEASSEAASSEATAELSGMVKISGSTSVESLSKALGEAFTGINPQVTVDVQGGGSGAAIKNVTEGVSDIGSLSRELNEEEKANGFTETVIAIDGIAVVVNPANTASDLTIDQIASIFKGEITNWSEVGGTDGEIVVIGREAGSGTRDGFEEIVGVADACKYTSELGETGQVKAQVAATPGAIGYISAGYVDDTVKALMVDGIACSTDTVKDGSYAIQRPFIMVCKPDVSAVAQAYLDFILSAEGQQIVADQHYVPVN